MNGLSIEILMTVYQLALTLCIFMIVYMQLMKSRRRDRKDLQKEAIKFITKWNSTEIVQASIRALQKSNIDKLYSLNARQKEPNERYDDVITLLNFLEEMALYIENDLVEEKILQTYFTQIIVELYKAFEPYIDFLRMERQNPTLYRHFEKLVNLWMFSKI